MKIEKIIYWVIEKVIDLESLIYDKVYGTPDVIIFGENHLERSHADFIAKKIRYYKPEYVLMEAFDDKKPEELKEIVESYKVRTLKDISEKYNVSLEDMGIEEDLIQEINEKIKKDKNYNDGYIPKNLKELITKPLYELHPKVIETIYERVYNSLGSHKEILQTILKYKRYGDNIEDIKNKRYDIILSAVTDVGAEIVGCDINKSNIIKEIEKINDEFLNANMQLYELFKGKINKDNIEEFVEKFYKIFEKMEKERSKVIHETNPKREQAMYERIKEYLNKRSSDAPIIVIVGKGHTHNIAKKFEEDEDNIRYRIINLPSLEENMIHKLFYRG